MKASEPLCIPHFEKKKSRFRGQAASGSNHSRHTMPQPVAVNQSMVAAFKDSAQKLWDHAMI